MTACKDQAGRCGEASVEVTGHDSASHMGGKEQKPGLESQRDNSQRSRGLHGRNVIGKARMCWTDAAFHLSLCEATAESGKC